MRYRNKRLVIITIYAYYDKKWHLVPKKKPLVRRGLFPVTGSFTFVGSSSLSASDTCS